MVGKFPPTRTKFDLFCLKIRLTSHKININSTKCKSLFVKTLTPNIVDEKCCLPTFYHFFLFFLKSIFCTAQNRYEHIIIIHNPSSFVSLQRANNRVQAQDCNFAYIVRKKQSVFFTRVDTQTSKIGDIKHQKHSACCCRMVCHFQTQVGSIRFFFSHCCLVLNHLSRKYTTSLSDAFKLDTVRMYSVC